MHAQAVAINPAWFSPDPVHMQAAGVVALSWPGLPPSQLKFSREGGGLAGESHTALILASLPIPLGLTCAGGMLQPSLAMASLSLTFDSGCCRLAWQY